MSELSELNGTILDIGCGSGEHLALLASTSQRASLFGVDFSESALRLAKERHSMPNTIKLACATGHALPFPGNTFDMVSCFGVVEHTSDISSFLEEIRRVSRPGGQILLSFSNPHSILQVINRLKAMFGLYPYGYQRNFHSADVESALKPLFLVDRIFIAHADWDMPLIRSLDLLIGRFWSHWGRYVLALCQKEGP
jgi:ubiquinone/menaquinone biosynthesis C-methylase UbiE